jgi:DNA-binding transcriptional ArsR family regulator
MPAQRSRARVRAPPPRQRESLVYRAIADDTRRRILQVLAEEGELTAGSIAARFDVSRPAVSKHLGVLRRAGLVAERRDGRERVYRIEGAPLREVMAFVASMERFWQRGLARLGEHLDEQP